MAILTGALVSGRLKSMREKKDNYCYKCGIANPPWDHLWACGVVREPPKDLLQRRFAWPLVPGDYQLHTDFLKGINAVMGR